MSKKIIEDMMNGKNRSKDSVKETAIKDSLELFAYWLD